MADTLGPNCTSAQCDEAVAYLMAGFGPWYDDQEKRQLRRLFLDYTPAEVRDAIDQLVKQASGSSKPRSSDVGAVLKANRRHLLRMAQAKDPEYATVAERPADWMHEMVEAVKAGDQERIAQLTAGAP